MKKTILIIIVAMTAAMTAKAQEALAVLTHGTTTKTFTGYYALRNAYASAVDGDLITLSSGTFGATNLAKTITIRGAGMRYDPTYNTQPTILDGDFSLIVPDASTGNVQIEGIYHGGIIYYNNYTQRSPKFIKCRLSRFWPGTFTGSDGKSYTCTIEDAQFLHCRISYEVVCNGSSSMTFINSFVRHPQTRNKSTSNLTLHNCVVDATYNSNSAIYSNFSYDDGSYSNVHLYSSSLTNCILVNTSSYNVYWGSYTSFVKCLLPSNWNPNLSSYWNYSKLADIFSTYDGTYGDTQAFLLTDDAKKKYKDEFGREVGLNGGSFPYSYHVAGPHIKSMQVSPRSTADGKLNIKMQIENTGY